MACLLAEGKGVWVSGPSKLDAVALYRWKGETEDEPGHWKLVVNTLMPDGPSRFVRWASIMHRHPEVPVKIVREPRIPARLDPEVVARRAVEHYYTEHGERTEILHRRCRQRVLLRHSVYVWNYYYCPRCRCAISDKAKLIFPEAPPVEYRNECTYGGCTRDAADFCTVCEKMTCRQHLVGRVCVKCDTDIRMDNMLANEHRYGSDPDNTSANDPGARGTEPGAIGGGAGEVSAGSGGGEVLAPSEATDTPWDRGIEGV